MREKRSSCAAATISPSRTMAPRPSRGRRPRSRGRSHRHGARGSPAAAAARARASDSASTPWARASDGSRRGAAEARRSAGGYALKSGSGSCTRAAAGRELGEARLVAPGRRRLLHVLVERDRHDQDRRRDSRVHWRRIARISRHAGRRARSYAGQRLIARQALHPVLDARAGAVHGLAQPREAPAAIDVATPAPAASRPASGSRGTGTLRSVERRPARARSRAWPGSRARRRGVR